MQARVFRRALAVQVAAWRRVTVGPMKSNLLSRIAMDTASANPAARGPARTDSAGGAPANASAPAATTDSLEVPRSSLTRAIPHSVMRHNGPLITGFRCQATERIWRGLRSHELPEGIQGVARRKLRYLNAAGRLGDLRVPPGNRLEVLKGDRDGQHSIRINRQWRICFRWSAGNAFDVEIVDYH